MKDFRQIAGESFVENIVAIQTLTELGFKSFAAQIIVRIQLQFPDSNISLERNCSVIEIQ